MDLHQVRYFLAVSQTLNFTRAAETCHVTQPSLSRAIKKLEEELGGDLFRRERSTTHLTDLGRTMLPLLQRCYESTLAAKTQAQSYGKATYAPLRMGLTHSINMDLLRPMVSALLRAYPGLELNLLRGALDDIVDELKGGDIELAIAADAGLDWERLDSWLLFEEPYELLLPLEHRLAISTLISLADLGDEPVVCPYCEFKNDIDRVFENSGVAPQRRHTTIGPADAIALVEIGLGVAFLPHSAGGSSTARLFPVADLGVTRSVRVYAVAGRQRSPAATTWIKLLRAADWSSVRH